MILAGTRPPGYAAARAERLRHAAEPDPAERDVRRDASAERSEEPAKSAVEIAPRPPSD